VTGGLLSWLPAFMAIVLSGLALAACAAPATPAARRTRLSMIAIVGSLTVAAMVWQASAASDQIARLIKDDQSKQLMAQVKSLQEQVARLQESTRARSLSSETAAGLSDYLRPFGGHKVIVSCVPGELGRARP
jgi:ABC-type transport system involved in cytochrome bd biosynthesis fused ATPase/permease subunit